MAALSPAPWMKTSSATLFHCPASDDASAGGIGGPRRKAQDSRRKRHCLHLLFRLQSRSNVLAEGLLRNLSDAGEREPVYHFEALRELERRDLALLQECDQ